MNSENNMNGTPATAGDIAATNAKNPSAMPVAPKETMLTRLAKIVSAVFSPLLMATYGVVLAMTLSFLCLIPTATKLTVILETFLATASLPIIGIFILFKLKAISDPRLDNRKDRLWPYIIEIICMAGMGIYLYHIHAPGWLPLFFFGGAAAVVVLAVVNLWWKISGHATGMGGLCALIFYLMLSGNSIYPLQWEFLGAVLAAGVVCSARLILDRHTLAQVAAGFANGFLLVLLPPLLFNLQQA